MIFTIPNEGKPSFKWVEKTSTADSAFGWVSPETLPRARDLDVQGSGSACLEPAMKSTTAVHPDFLLFDQHTPTIASKLLALFATTNSFPSNQPSLPILLATSPGLQLPHLLAS